MFLYEVELTAIQRKDGLTVEDKARIGKRYYPHTVAEGECGLFKHSDNPSRVLQTTPIKKILTNTDTVLEFETQNTRYTMLKQRPFFQ